MSARPTTAPPVETSARPLTEIVPAKGWASLDLRELWAYRELLLFFVWRDIKVRYKQTVLGAAWALLQPLATMVLFALFFGRLAGVPSDGIPYPLFAFTALVPWTFFSNAVTLSSNSLVMNQQMVTKVYFPRVAIPLATVLAGVVDLAIAFVLLLIFLAWYGVVPGVNVVWLPAFVLLALITASGVGFWLSALNVLYRDVRYVVPFLAQLWLFATPVAYPSSLLSDTYRTLYALNPMVGVVEGFRWSLLGRGFAPGPMLIASSVAAVAIFVSGAYFFRRMEDTFADVI